MAFSLNKSTLSSFLTTKFICTFYINFSLSLWKKNYRLELYLVKSNQLSVDAYWRHVLLCHCQLVNNECVGASGLYLRPTDCTQECTYSAAADWFALVLRTLSWRSRGYSIFTSHWHVYILLYDCSVAGDDAQNRSHSHRERFEGHFPSSWQKQGFCFNDLH